MSEFPWTCPFCNHDTIIRDQDVTSGNSILFKENKHGMRKATILFIVCPNPKCKEFSLYLSLFEYIQKYEDIFLKQWGLIPPSSAKAFPSYIPKPIIDDYEEACLIKDLSPKASATLARRCLQGMIRDFWGIRKSRLKEEIDALEEKIDPLTWQAIDSVRHIGNIGAHMEKDINSIIDVDPNEAALLIELIETLIKDWYITRREREERLKSIVAIKEQKQTKQENSEE